MRRPTKKWIVETFTHRGSGASLSVYYDKDAEKFWGKIGNKEIEAKTQKEAKVELNKTANILLSSTSETGWKRLLIISVDTGPHNTHYRGVACDDACGSPRVGLDFMRVWVRAGSDGERYTRDWERAESAGNLRDRQEAFQDVCDYRSRYLSSREIPYSDAAWSALMAASSKLREIRAQLLSLVKQDDLAKVLVESIPQLLGD